MIFVEKNFEKPPAILESEACKAHLLQVIENRKKPKGTFYRGEYKGQVKAQVVEHLQSLYHNKCAYCEAIEPEPEIEHYRPKSGVQGLKKTEHQGYYWLCYEWSNLLPVCHKCNKVGAKGTKFPIKSAAKRVKQAPRKADGSLNYTAFDARNAPLIDEEALLIHPELINPYEHLTFDNKGFISAKNNSLMGQTTIEVCRLNRDELIIYRQAIINNFVHAIEHCLAERYAQDDPLNPKQFQRRMFRIFNKMIKQQLPQSAFSLLGIVLLENFEAFILAQLEVSFRKLVQDTFLNYLNQKFFISK